MTPRLTPPLNAPPTGVGVKQLFLQESHIYYHLKVFQTTIHLSFAPRPQPMRVMHHCIFVTIFWFLRKRVSFIFLQLTPKGGGWVRVWSKAQVNCHLVDLQTIINMRFLQKKLLYSHPRGGGGGVGVSNELSFERSSRNILHFFFIDQ